MKYKEYLIWCPELGIDKDNKRKMIAWDAHEAAANFVYDIEWERCEFAIARGEENVTVHILISSGEQMTMEVSGRLERYYDAILKKGEEK